LPIDDRNNEANQFKASPTGPHVAPPRTPANPPPEPPRIVSGRRHTPIWSVAIFVLLISGFGIRAYRDLSRPEAWAYWKESYFSPSMTSSPIARVDLDGSGHDRQALAISGTIGAATATWLRERLDHSHLSTGDVVLLSSRGGNLDQAVIMGEIIRSRGLATAVGTADASGHVTRSYCASACVFVYAGGTTRYGIDGSRLGVHRFVASSPSRDPVADAQRITGMILSYMSRMGVGSSVVQAMSETSEVRWLDPAEALAMHLTTEPIQKLGTARR
jgi:hypothetical protein